MNQRDLARWLEVGAVVGLGAVVLQRLALGQHVAAPAPTTTGPLQGISILKPLCGVDDGLEDSLERFAALTYPRYEMLLGLESARDPAASIAARVARRHPNTTRVLVKQRDVGLNPKVNQLAGLERAARNDVLLISDSNTRPAPGYLNELSALFGDARVGCVTNPVVGAGYKGLGAAMDAMHLADVAGTVVAAKRAGVDLGVGKSQALRRAALRSVGGFAAYANVLAEDYMLARDIGRRGWRVAVARTPVVNWTEKRDVQGFVDRYSRWSTMQATAEGNAGPALAAAMSNPIPMALGAAMLGGSLPLALGVAAAKAALDVGAARALGVDAGLAEAAVVPAKDLALGLAQLRGLFTREVSWRGKPTVAVGGGTRLSRVR